MFSNLNLGPLIAINSLEDVQQHKEFILEKGFIPHVLITDRKHKVFDNFKTDKHKKFETVAVFITVQYIEAYE